LVKEIDKINLSLRYYWGGGGGEDTNLSL